MITNTLKNGNKSTLGERLRAARVQNGLTLNDGGQIAGMNASQLSRIETGHTTNPGITSIKLLADAYGVLLDELMDD